MVSAHFQDWYGTPTLQSGLWDPRTCLNSYTFQGLTAAKPCLFGYVHAISSFYQDSNLLYGLPWDLSNRSPPLLPDNQPFCLYPSTYYGLSTLLLHQSTWRRASKDQSSRIACSYNSPLLHISTSTIIHETALLHARPRNTSTTYAKAPWRCPNLDQKDRLLAHTYFCIAYSFR